MSTPPFVYGRQPAPRFPLYMSCHTQHIFQLERPARYIPSYLPLFRAISRLHDYLGMGSPRYSCHLCRLGHSQCRVLPPNGFGRGELSSPEKDGSNIWNTSGPRRHVSTWDEHPQGWQSSWKPSPLDQRLVVWSNIASGNVVPSTVECMGDGNVKPRAARRQFKYEQRPANW